VYGTVGFDSFAEMISQNLKNIFLLLIPIFIAHGLEEYFTDFYHMIFNSSHFWKIGF